MQVLEVNELHQVVGGVSTIELSDLYERVMRQTLLGSTYREPLVLTAVAQ